MCAGAGWAAFACTAGPVPQRKLKPRPALSPSPPCSANNVVMGAFYYVVVSGTKSTDAGAFKLTLVNK